MLSGFFVPTLLPVKTRTQLRRLDMIRYAVPLREGGSLPAVVEASDGVLYVAKFRGAGQGKRALIAEIIGGEMARTLGLRMPELVLLDLDAAFGRNEPDPEIQDLLRFSEGLNLGMTYLPTAIVFDPLVREVNPFTASVVVLLDSVITNLDRTPRNTNLLIWNDDVWLIDHGAALYFHHNWATWERTLGKTFPLVREHVLLPDADMLPEAADHLRERLPATELQRILALIPDEWLREDADDWSPEQRRAAYLQLLTDRLDRLDALTKEARDARL